MIPKREGRATMASRGCRRLRFRGALFVFSLIIISAGVTGCWQRPVPGAGPSPGLGSGMGVLAVSAALEDAGSPEDVLYVTLRHVGLVIERALPVVDGEARGVLEGIYEGPWD